MASSFFPLLLRVAIAATAPAEPSHLLIDGCNFDETYAFNKTECQITLTNEGSSQIHVSNVKAVTPRDSIDPSEATIPPYSKAYFKALIDTGNSVARTRHRFTFHTDESGNPDRVAAARGFVLTALDQVKPKLEFGVVDINAESPVKSIELTSRETTDFRIVKVLEKPDFVHATLDPRGSELRVLIKADASWGIHEGFIKLAINAPLQKETWVAVRADLHGDVVPSVNPIDFGLLRFGNNNEYTVQVSSRSKASLKIGGIDLIGVVGTTTVLPCKPEADSCRLIRLVITDKQPAGAIRGMMWVNLPDLKKKIRIDVQGLIIGNDVKVHDISNPDLTDSHDDVDTNASKISTSRKSSTDLAQALQNIAHTSSGDPAPGYGPLLRWTVANGNLIYGFQIFRGDSEKGHFALLTTPTIPSTAQNNGPVTYQWRDGSATAGKEYWYYIGIVNNDGSKQQLSSPQKITAK